MIENKPFIGILLVKGHGPISWVIKKSTQSEYSHIGFVIGNKTYEMDFDGFCSRDIETYPWKYTLYELTDIPNETVEELRSWCLMHRFTPYDYGKFVRQWLALVSHFAGLQSLLESKGAMSCSEFVCAGLKFMGACDDKCELATPESIRLLLAEKGIIRETKIV